MPTKTMRSRLTGKLQTYILTEELITCDRFEVDMTELKNNIQNEYDTQGIDAQAEKCKHIRARTYDYIIVNTWVAAEPVAGTLLIPVVLIPLIAKAIIFILAYAAIVVITYLGVIGIREAVFPPNKFYCSLCGEGPFGTVAELTAHRREAHPDAAAHQCPYCGQAFATIEQLNAHIEECPWRPPPFPPWLPWVVGGVVAVGVIYVASKILISRKVV